MRINNTEIYNKILLLKKFSIENKYHISKLKKSVISHRHHLYAELNFSRRNCVNLNNYNKTLLLQIQQVRAENALVKKQLNSIVENISNQEIKINYLTITNKNLILKIQNIDYKVRTVENQIFSLTSTFKKLKI